MELNRKALYNSLRMNWIMEPTAEVESWQVEDYRAMPLDGLFERLEDKNIRLDKPSFLAFSETVDTPEDLAEALLPEASDDMELYDQVYLVVFELWRRLLPEKPSLSIFCDELDHQIHLYDRGQLESSEAIEDAIANLQVILDENTDEGADPQDAFTCVSQYCANDLESFLHDFISDQIDNDNTTYAAELIDGFAEYVSSPRWFEFLRARLLSLSSPAEAMYIVKKLIGDKKAGPDLEFNFEVLSFLVAYGDRETFEFLVMKTAEILQVEADFQTLLSICMDFYHRLDIEAVEKALQGILKNREKLHPEKILDANDLHLLEMFQVIANN